MQNPLPSNLQEVVYFEAFINYTRIHFADGTSQWHSYTLKRYERLLGEPFYRFHRRYIVNKNYIQDIQSLPQRRLVLHCGREIPVARRR
ncbi:MAG: LytR/AlgR family response regulator transcription factor [Spirosomataceae bacterium]